MISANHHTETARDFLNRVMEYMECNTQNEQAQAMEVIIKQATKKLISTKGIDATMCFLWPMMEAMNEKLLDNQKAANQEGVNHVAINQTA